MFKIIAIVAVVVLAGVLIYAATRPDTFSVQRSLAIKAPPEKIYALIADFRKWGEWSPYEKLDPAMQRSFSGADSGQGAVYAWDSKGKAGAGRMEITQTTAPNSIVIQLDFVKPFEAHNTATFTLQGEGDATRVSWTMSGRANYFHKLLSVFLNMDQLIGKDFETGLDNIKRITEQQ